MKAILPLAMLACAVSLAGCAGEFDVRQTEPIRVQVDGEPQQSRVSSDGGRSDTGGPQPGPGGEEANDTREFRLEKAPDTQTVTVVVEVTQVMEGAAPAPGDNDTGGNDTGDNATDENDTAKQAVVLVIVEDRDTREKLAEETVEADDQGNQVQLDIDVKGHDNVVIITQAVEGTADVMVSAQSQEGGGNMTGNQTGGNTSTGYP